MQPIRESAKVEILPEAWGEVDRHVLMPLLKTVVLADVMQVVPSNDDGPLHLHLGHHTWKKVTTLVHIRCISMASIQNLRFPIRTKIQQN